jgi:hypothetical protein
MESTEKEKEKRNKKKSSRVLLSKEPCNEERRWSRMRGACYIYSNRTAWVKVRTAISTYLLYMLSLHRAHQFHCLVFRKGDRVKSNRRVQCSTTSSALTTIALRGLDSSTLAFSLRMCTTIPQSDGRYQTFRWEDMSKHTARQHCQGCKSRCNLGAVDE